MNRRAFLRRSGLATGGAVVGAAAVWPVQDHWASAAHARSGQAVGAERPAGVAGTSVTYRVRTTAPLVALTFDDGPSNRYTGRLLDILDAADVSATFFMIGSSVARHPELARRVAARHEIGNHTWSHADLSVALAADATAQLRRAADEIVTTVGAAPRAFRPPYGRFSGATAMVAAGMDYPIVLWDHKFDVNASARSNVDRLDAATGPGSILLGHDGGTLDNDVVLVAVRSLIHRLRDRGLRFGMVSQLLATPAASAIPDRATPSHPLG